MIKVKRNKDGKVFTSDMSKEEGIYEIHFCTSYTQVKIQELNEAGKLISMDIICEPIGTAPNWSDRIATSNNDHGKFI